MSHISNYAIKIVDFPPISFSMCKNRFCIWWWYIYDTNKFSEMVSS